MAEAKRRQLKKKMITSTNIINKKVYYNAFDNEEVTGLLTEKFPTHCNTVNRMRK